MLPLYIPPFPYLLSFFASWLHMQKTQCVPLMGALVCSRQSSAIATGKTELLDVPDFKRSVWMHEKATCYKAHQG